MLRRSLRLISVIALVLAGAGCAAAPVDAGGSAAAAEQASTGGTVHVKGYFRKDGTYVRPHTRRAPRR